MSDVHVSVSSVRDASCCDANVTRRRVEKCTAIRRELGDVLTCGDNAQANREALKLACNAFVREGTPDVVSMETEGGVVVLIELTLAEDGNGKNDEKFMQMHAPASSARGTWTLPLPSPLASWTRGAARS